MVAEKPGGSNRQGLMHLAGMGVELAATLLVFCLIGIWIDRHWPSIKPWGTVVCSLLGIVGGLYNLIRKALLESLGAKPRARRVKDDPRAGGAGPGSEQP